MRPLEGSMVGQPTANPLQGKASDDVEPRERGSAGASRHGLVEPLHEPDHLGHPLRELLHGGGKIGVLIELPHVQDDVEHSDAADHGGIEVE